MSSTMKKHHLRAQDVAYTCRRPGVYPVESGDGCLPDPANLSGRAGIWADFCNKERLQADEDAVAKARARRGLCWFLEDRAGRTISSCFRRRSRRTFSYSRGRRGRESRGDLNRLKFWYTSRAIRRGEITGELVETDDADAGGVRGREADACTLDGVG